MVVVGLLCETGMESLVLGVRAVWNESVEPVDEVVESSSMMSSMGAGGGVGTVFVAGIEFDEAGTVVRLRDIDLVVTAFAR